MANFCYPLHDNIDEKLVEVVVIPEATTVTAGHVLMAETLATGSNKVYDGTVVADITADKPGIIIDQNFEQLADGRRPDGGNILTDITFTAGDKVHVVRFSENMKYEIAQDVIDNTGVVAPAAGVYLVAQDAGTKLATASTLVGTEAVVLKIEAVASVPTGGNMGLGFSGSVIARVIKA